MSDGVRRPGCKGLLVNRAIVQANVRTLVSAVDGATGAIADLSGDAYGHGLVAAAAAVVEGGASAVCVSNGSDAVVLRESGFTAPVWVARVASDDRLADFAALDIGLLIGSAELAQRALDSGIDRLGVNCGSRLQSAHPDAVTAIAGVLARHRRLAMVRSLIIVTDSSAQAASVSPVFSAHGLALDGVYSRSIGSEHQDLAISPILGSEVFGLSETASPPIGVIPAATLTAPVLALKHADAGIGVSYGYTYVTRSSTTLALVPFGYGDGVDRSAGNAVPAQIGTQRFTIAGRVAMDASVFDVGDAPVAIGDPVIFFGSGDNGEPTVHEWAAALGMPSAAIVAGLTDRVERVWI